MDFICKKCWTQKRVIISDQQKNKLFLPTSNLFSIIRNVTNIKDVIYKICRLYFERDNNSIYTSFYASISVAFNHLPVQFLHLLSDREFITFSASYQTPGMSISTSFSSTTLFFNVWLGLALRGIVWLEFVNNTETRKLGDFFLQMIFIIPGSSDYPRLISVIIVDITSCVLSTLCGSMNHPN